MEGSNNSDAYDGGDDSKCNDTKTADSNNYNNGKGNNNCNGDNKNTGTRAIPRLMTTVTTKITKAVDNSDNGEGCNNGAGANVKATDDNDNGQNWEARNNGNDGADDTKAADYSADGEGGNVNNGDSYDYIKNDAKPTVSKPAMVMPSMMPRQLKTVNMAMLSMSIIVIISSPIMLLRVMISRPEVIMIPTMMQRPMRVKTPTLHMITLLLLLLLPKLAWWCGLIWVGQFC